VSPPRRPIVVPTRTLLVAAAALIVTAAGAAPAAAKAPRCPSGTDVVWASWGSGNPYGGNGDVAGTSYPQTGLAKARRVHVRTTGGRHRSLVLCADGRLRARLPALRGRQFVTAVAVNGPYVAWAVRPPGRPARVAVGRVQHGRLRAVRRTSTATGLSASRTVPSGAFLVLPDGTTAWSAFTTREPVGAVWPRGEAVAPFFGATPDAPLSAVPPSTTFGNSIAVLDDRNVLLEGRVIRAYRPTVAGTCPVLTTGTWHELGGWKVADAGGEWDENDDEPESTAWSVVCDPASGHYIDLTRTRYHSGRGHYGQTTTGSTARNGRWLLRAVIGRDDDRGATAVTITDPATGERHVAEGHLEVPGLPPVIETPPDTVEASPTHRGATAIRGATAWIERTSAAGKGDSVWLSDADGTRAVGSAAAVVPDPPGDMSPGVSARRSVRDLALSETTLSWTGSDGTRSTHAVRPIASEPFAVHAGPPAP
jgi:hypothetical protein